MRYHNETLRRNYVTTVVLIVHTVSIYLLLGVPNNYSSSPQLLQPTVTRRKDEKNHILVRVCRSGGALELSSPPPPRCRLDFPASLGSSPGSQSGSDYHGNRFQPPRACKMNILMPFLDSTGDRGIWQDIGTNLA